jgi:glyoxylase-like metal-dependent hydrolase (beta-lactamase superfamily II)
VGNESGVECASKLIEDNEYLTIDDINIRVLYTPGHTNDSYCFLVDSIKPGILFTGDTLLIRGTGRTDFQNGDPSKLYDSITNKIFILYDDTEIYPGHDYNGFSKSTIEEEKNYNPRLNLKSKKEFIDLMNNLDLPDPDMMDIAIPLNENCGLEK